MVIQPNMTPEAIAGIWENTRLVFNKFNLLLTDIPLELSVKTDTLIYLLKELNDTARKFICNLYEGG